MYDIVESFQRTLAVEWSPPSTIIGEIKKITKRLSDSEKELPDKVRKKLVAEISRKFSLNSKPYQDTLDYLASKKILLNYHQKKRFNNYLNLKDIAEYKKWIKYEEKLEPYTQDLIKLFNPVSQNEAITFLKKELENESNKDNVLESLFGAFAFYSFNKRSLHKIFNPDIKNTGKYIEHYFDHLKHFYPKQIDRKHALTLLEINSRVQSRFDNKLQFKNAIFDQIHEEYRSLNNHCYFFVLIRNDLNQQMWELYSEILLYAEKFREYELKKSYFRPKLIKEKTCDYIAGCDPDQARFNFVNEGFTYEDCFIVSPNHNNQQGYDILLTFVKNERDETPIPCPACRSMIVQGNSYPIVGVRSWECKNKLCPDRSKYNRGKRYALSSIIKQEAIENPKNNIKLSTIKKWKFDILESSSDEDLLKTVIQLYSLWNDKIKLINHKLDEPKILGRKIEFTRMTNANAPKSKSRFRQFNESSFFKRFLIARKADEKPTLQNLSNLKGVKVYHGDAFKILQSLESNSIGGAITSPPYYNAREYSSWANIYTYLYDMYNILIQTNRVLKDGSLYLFNIFDYFDNENIVVQSAMGKKRMVLGAYFLKLFQEAGFQIQKNVIWDKGEIEGKRHFNQGNYSPYYQRPFNSWEHIFVFTKGSPNTEQKKIIQALPDVLREKPVLKMFNGKNILGHTAPFPPAIPNLLLNLIDPDSVIIDPFSGSMTTGIAASQHGIRSVNIDYKLEYCYLGIELLKKEFPESQLASWKSEGSRIAAHSKHISN